MKNKLLFFFVFSIFIQTHGNAQWKLMDKNATRETKNLFKSLKKIQRRGTIFAHQHATEYGRGWRNEENKSDIKSVIGSHPGMIGVDFSGFTGPNADVYKKNLKKTVEDAYNRGAIITVAWHFYNPVGSGGFYWQDSISTPVVPRLIPGGDSHNKYKEILNDIADWTNSCKGKNGELVPMIFRPYHEFDGDWFWWGASHCTVDEFKSLWKFTASYLRDTKNVHNFIWAFSPDNKFNSEEEYLQRYPGDEWVDLVGMDNYADLGRDGYHLETAVKKLKIVSDYARKHKKLAAFTETGLETLPNTVWWTGALLRVLKSENLRLCYVLVWRNDTESKTHFYAPYPGDKSVPDFKKFYNDKFTLFEDDVAKKNVYKKNLD